MKSESDIVVVIENDQTICQYVAELLEDNGFVSFTATSACEAIKLMNVTNDISILITDIDLGEDLTGFDLAKTARKIFGDIPIIYVTGSASAGNKLVVRSKFMLKPYDDATLINNIKEMLVKNNSL